MEGLGSFSISGPIAKAVFQEGWKIETIISESR
jgi:hypothetical protein